MEQWLLLTDYASKYRVSVSTLRRRIKAGQQAHRFEAGRYYLPDQEIPNVANTPMSAAIAAPLKTVATAPSANLSAPSTAAKNGEPIVTTAAAASSVTEEPLITTTSRLLNELKQAYTLILHEKEEQIIFLKEEIADLKTLVRVLESDNARLRGTN